MPFKTEKQRTYLWANEPKIARKWTEEHGSEPVKKNAGGLYANIHAKRKRIKAGSGEKMRKVGSKGAPTKQSFIDSAKTAKKASGGTVITPKGFGLMLPNKKQTTTIY